jgi:hypothetical protein
LCGDPVGQFLHAVPLDKERDEQRNACMGEPGRLKSNSSFDQLWVEVTSEALY